MPTARPSSIIRRYGVHITQLLGISPPLNVLTELGFAVAKYVLPSKSYRIGLASVRMADSAI
jgi:hypothetical protein